MEMHCRCLVLLTFGVSSPVSSQARVMRRDACFAVFAVRCGDIEGIFSPRFILEASQLVAVFLSQCAISLARSFFQHNQPHAARALLCVMDAGQGDHKVKGLSKQKSLDETIKTSNQQWSLKI